MLTEDKTTATVVENICLLENRISRQQEKTLALLAELVEAHAEILCSSGGERAPLFHELSSAFPSPLPHSAHLSEHHHALSVALACGKEALIPTYVCALAEVCAQKGAPLTLQDFLPIRLRMTSKIAYMKNPYADEAYEALAPVLPSPTASYVGSYRASCEEVALGEADFCILPYQNAGGYLPSTNALVDRHGLLRVSSCRVFHADGTDVTHFALYGKEFLPVEENAACTLSYYFSYLDEGVLSRHFAALSAFSVKAKHVVSEPNEDAAFSMRAFLTVGVPKKTLIPFLTYLAIFTSGCVINGLYKEKEV